MRPTPADPRQAGTRQPRRTLAAVRRWLLFLPSLALGVLGGVWLLFRPLPYAPTLGPLGQAAAGVAAGAVLLGGAWVLERTVPSFRYASRLLEHALRSVELPAWTALLLAAVTAASEELFFRGALLPLVGLIPQALLFGLLHPVPRRAWAYPAFVVAAGLVFGVLTQTTGSLVPAMVAHFGVNLQGFWEVRHRDGAAPAVEAPWTPDGSSEPEPPTASSPTALERSAASSPPATQDPEPDEPAPDEPTSHG